MEDHLLRGALAAQDRQHVVVRVPVVDHQRLAHPLGQVDVPGERLGLHGRAGRRPSSGPARSRRSRPPGGRRPAASSLRGGRHRPACRPGWGAGRPRRTGRGARCGGLAAQRAEARSSATVTTRLTPTAAARAIAAARPAESRQPQASRWVCASMTGAGSGSGGGSQRPLGDRGVRSRSPVIRRPRPLGWPRRLIAEGARASKNTLHDPRWRGRSGDRGPRARLAEPGPAWRTAGSAWPAAGPSSMSGARQDACSAA